jgi:hypothetical protein
MLIGWPSVRTGYSRRNCSAAFLEDLFTLGENKLAKLAALKLAAQFETAGLGHVLSLGQFVPLGCLAVLRAANGCRAVPSATAFVELDLPVKDFLPGTHATNSAG